MLRHIPAAAEARSKVEEFRKEKFKVQWDTIAEQIAAAIKEGNCIVSGDGHLDAEIIDTLKQRGYSIGTGSHYNEPHYSISWKE